ncbi:sigma-70 family RNA polymerase sigma factor [Thermomonas brevis]
MPATATYPSDLATGEDFGQRLQAHAGIVRKVAATYAWTPHDREDLMQDIIAALWQAWPRYDPARPFSTWMYRVALNVAVSQVRGETRRRRHHVAWEPDVHGAPLPAHDHEGDERVALLQQAMQALDAMNRALLMLHLDERSHREIAEVLGISESNVGTRLNRLKARLRQALTSD